MNLTLNMFAKFSMNFIPPQKGGDPSAACAVLSMNCVFKTLFHNRANKTFVKPFRDQTFCSQNSSYIKAFLNFFY